MSNRPSLHVRLPWIDAELAVVRDFAGRLSAPALARALGRSEKSVHQARMKLGLTTSRAPRGAELEAYLRDKHAAGWTDSEVAAGWTDLYPGCAAVDRHGIGLIRARIGLPSNKGSARYRRRVAERTREQLRAAGLPSIGWLRKVAFARRATAAGWPADLRPRHVDILNALWDRGPLTRREMCAAIGMRWRGSRQSLTSNDAEGSYLAHLLGRGLVVSLGKVVRHPDCGKGGRAGQGKNVTLYSLPLTIQRRKVANADE